MKITLTIKVLLTFYLCSVLTSNSQELNIEETLNYINESLGDFRKVSIGSDGQFIFTKYTNDLLIKGFKTQEEANEYNKKIKLGQYKKIKEFTMESNVRDFMLKKGITYNLFTIEMNCNSCWTKRGKWTRNEHKLDIRYFKKRERDKIYNAIVYLIGLVKNSAEFNQVDNDPFANENFNNTYSFITSKIIQQDINLFENGGVYLLNTSVNGIEQTFILDSGASDVSISPNLERELIAKEKIKKEDYVEPALYRIADGSIISARRVILKEIKIGEFIVKNVIATIGNNKNAPFLLGRGFLDNFSKWSIDNKKNILTLTK